MTTLTTYPLRLPKSIKAAAERLSKADGTSLNQFVATAVAEKVAIMEAAAFFELRAERARSAAARGEPSALLAILNRAGGEPPRKDDELPEGYVPIDGTALPAGKAKAKTQTGMERPSAPKASRKKA